MELIVSIAGGFILGVLGLYIGMVVLSKIACVIIDLLVQLTDGLD